MSNMELRASMEHAAKTLFTLQIHILKHYPQPPPPLPPPPAPWRERRDDAAGRDDAGAGGVGVGGVKVAGRGPAEGDVGGWTYFSPSHTLPE